MHEMSSAIQTRVTKIFSLHNFQLLNFYSKEGKGEGKGENLKEKENVTMDGGTFYSMLTMYI